MTRHHADIAGQRLSWLQAGQGQPVVLLHAFPLHAAMWQPQLETVPHGWTLIAPDLRGFGESAGPAAARSVDDHAADVLALLRHLNIERAVIGGLSMGGYITFALARVAPQRCRALVLADTRAEADTPEMRANREKSQAAAREQGTMGVWTPMEPKAVGPAARAAGTLVPALRAMAEDNNPARIIDSLEALKTRPDSRPGLPLITCPTLVIVGEDDELTPPAVSDAIQRDIPGARLVRIPQAGHMSNLEQPDAFNRALWTFVQGL
jgi:pimeloyl-ACP methyl ester carboxylesterase